MMWAIIMLLVFGVLISGIVYLVSRAKHFTTVSKLCKNNKRVMRIASSTAIVLLFAVLSLIFDFINAVVIIIHLVIIWLVCDGINHLIAKLRKKETKYYYAGVVAVICTIVWLSFGYCNAMNISRTAYDLDTQKNVGDGIKLVQITDSHIGATFDGETFANHMEEYINPENPDVVVVTGDFVDDGTSKQDMIAAAAGLGKLKTKYGVYYVFGNHDKGYYSSEMRGYNTQDLKDELEKNGVVILEDSSVLINNTFYIVGRQDKSTKGRAELDSLLGGIDKSKYIIVLDHQPQDYANEEAMGSDLVLSGHTHGGQFIPINYVGEWIGVNDKTYGIEKRDNTNFIVSSGIADWELVFKTGCISEYVVVTIK